MSLDVLVVEDDFMVASIHRRFVERVPGFRVVGEAHSGADALAAVEALRPDLVLLDVHLPDMSGIEVLRRLRAAGHDLGVVVITAAREADTVRAAAAGGAAHYLVKPFASDDLRARLEAFRRAHEALDGLDRPGGAGQAEIDALLAPQPSRHGSAERPALPKGLSQETADAVLAALAGGAEHSAAECADAVGVSRVSARRYLEHFATTGRAAVRLNYGTAGRPERRYRLR
ncbi:response regulator [Krasilnikoviella flava]|uniref:Transcriptional regulatory protein n=1 Tax=Krasilnikoviella flava TaxID=526729 RepID=A0A1T5ISI8_9MICO|nr:response regulator [Krasilnikoviella flava]SKC41948.1 Response regulator of citrate/malate metabolism [Krasilnikoviella flava]